MTQAVFWSWLRAFATAALTVLLADVADGGFSGIDWEAIGIAGVLAVGPVILNWLNPNDPRYGRFTPADPSIGQADPQLDQGGVFDR